MLSGIFLIYTKYDQFNKVSSYLFKDFILLLKSWLRNRISEVFPQALEATTPESIRAAPAMLLRHHVMALLNLSGSQVKMDLLVLWSL